MVAKHFQLTLSKIINIFTDFSCVLHMEFRMKNIANPQIYKRTNTRTNPYCNMKTEFIITKIKFYRIAFAFRKSITQLFLNEFNIFIFPLVSAESLYNPNE